MVESQSAMNSPIGGYFSLELPVLEEYHKSAIKLNTGRNCLEYILRCRNFKKVYIPYYTCEVILEPFKKTGTEYSFYCININFEIADDIILNEGEALLYTNYYGLKQRYAESLATKYGHQLILDNTQSFYAKPILGIDTFYTCRKFFGVPDGAYLYSDKTLETVLEQDVSYNRFDFLIKRIDLSAEDGFADFLKSDESLEYRPIKRMSKLTERLMQSINYDVIAKKRRQNFCLIHEELQTSNQLQIHLEDDTVPMIYPYLANKPGLRKHLIQNKIFVAQYWPNVLEWRQDMNNKECYLTLNMQALPIDQRYDENYMNRIVSIIKGWGQI